MQGVQKPTEEGQTVPMASPQALARHGCNINSPCTQQVGQLVLSSQGEAVNDAEPFARRRSGRCGEGCRAGVSGAVWNGKKS